MSITQQISHNEAKQFRERQNTFNPRQFEVSAGSYYRHQFHEYMFELENKTSTDFTISLPVAQDVAFFLYSYTNHDGVYSLTNQIGDDMPVEVNVIENNYRVIRNQTFYFRKFVIFEGKEHYTYTIRLKNQGQSRLFALSVVHLLEQSHISAAIDTEELKTHEARSKRLYEEVDLMLGQSQSRRTMELSNQNRLNSKIQTYYIYSAFEMLIVIGFSILQLKMIEKLLNKGSIV